MNFWIRGARKLEYVVHGDLYDKVDIEVEFKKVGGGEAKTIHITPGEELLLESLGFLKLQQVLEL